MTLAFTRLALLAGPLLLLLLTAIAGYSYSQILSLSLPIPQSLALFTVVLPLITGISTQGAYGLIKRSSKNEQYQLTIPLIAVIGFQLVYETIVATLAITYILPPSALRCGLDTKWLQLFRSKDGDAIRAIQDSLNCCGLNSIRDRGWPFDDPLTCSKTFKRDQSCFPAWRKAEQTNAGLLLLVAVIVFIVKVLSIISLLTSSSFSQSRWAHPFKRGGIEGVEESEGDNRATVRRLIEEHATDEGYRDDPSEAARALEAPSGENGQGPRVEPSPLTDSGHEWRE